MGSRWFNLTIVLVWLSTTTWLVVAKIVPPLRRGEPPNYRSMYSDQAADKPSYVAWDMTLNGNSLGYAVISLTKKMSGDMTDVESRIHFEHIPLEELSPAWMKALMRTAVLPSDNLHMYVNSHLIIDKLGYLSEFSSTLRVAGLPDAIIIRGTINGTVLKIKVRSGEIEYPFDAYLPSDALVSDELSPQLCLTGLRVGQEWTVPVFSPLRPPNNPVDVLQARVERRDLLMWEGQTVPVNVVEYRTDSGSALSSTSHSRAKLWVRDDGAVLKQQVSVLGSELVFVRLSDDRSDELYTQSIEDEPERPRRWGRGRMRWSTPPMIRNSDSVEGGLSAPASPSAGPTEPDHHPAD
ncbi:MAG TPA: hypothetical protein VGJ04_09650 [Pirellulales bacterium]|jgi:hypothetical protein